MESCTISGTLKNIVANGFALKYLLAAKLAERSAFNQHERPRKGDILGHSMFEKLKRMEDMTGISPKSISLDDISDLDLSLLFEGDIFDVSAYDAVLFVPNRDPGHDLVQIYKESPPGHHYGD